MKLNLGCDSVIRTDYINIKEAGFIKEPRFQIGGFDNGTNIRGWINK